jgi:hypothetical protein
MALFPADDEAAEIAKAMVAQRGAPGWAPSAIEESSETPRSSARRDRRTQSPGRSGIHKLHPVAGATLDSRSAFGLSGMTGLAKGSTGSHTRPGLDCRHRKFAGPQFAGAPVPSGGSAG